MKNMKYMKYMKYILMVIFSGFLLNSCTKDFLETEPYENLSTAVAISSVDDATVALMGAYSALQSSNYYGRNFVVTPDVASDNVKVSPENSGRFLSEYNYSMIATSGNPRTFWNIAYDAIDRTNHIIEIIPSLESGDAADRNQILGEALAIRALVHFDLVRYFAQPYNLSDNSAADNANGSGGHLGVPYIKISEIGTPSRNTVAEVYTEIVADLQEAISLMASTNTTSGRFSGIGAKALLAKVYLYMEDWANTKQMAADVINSGVYSLVPTASYISSWGLEYSTESVLSLAMSIVDYRQTNALGYIYLESGYGDLVATADLMDLYEADDVRGYDENNLDADGVSGWFKLVSGAVYINKYPGRDGTDGLDNTPILRLSEMYLIRAEAQAELGETTAAVADLDLIRQRGNPSATATTVAGAALIDEILLERQKDLAFEGNRLWDLTRRKRSVVRVDHTLENGTTPYPNVRFAYPIPQRELDANPNMVQNKGY